MEVLKENSDKITVEFKKTEFLMIQNFFRFNDPDKIKKMCILDEFNIIENFVYLEDTDKGFYDELSKFLNQQNQKNKG